MSHIGKCSHGVMLDFCQKCYPRNYTVNSETKGNQMKHKHAEVLIAIAEGRAVEYCAGSEKWCKFNEWLNPIKDDYLDWRVTPPPRPQWQQNLIDAAKAGEIVEYKFRFSSKWEIANILMRNPDGWYSFGDKSTVDYRIQPTKVTRYLWAVKDFTGCWCAAKVFKTEQEIAASSKGLEYLRLDYTATEFEE